MKTNQVRKTTKVIDNGFVRVIREGNNVYVYKINNGEAELVSTIPIDDFKTSTKLGSKVTLFRIK